MCITPITSKEKHANLNPRDRKAIESTPASIPKIGTQDDIKNLRKTLHHLPARTSPKNRDGKGMR
jgi:hypothetical protein